MDAISDPPQPGMSACYNSFGASLFGTSPDLTEDSRKLSPPPASASRLSRGIPFSDMLDLATAKAENITGIYYAKEMNRKSMPPLPTKDSVSTTLSPSTDLGLPHATYHEHAIIDREGSAKIRIDINASFPVSSRKPFPEADKCTVLDFHGEHQGIPSPTVQHSRTLTNTGPSTSLAHPDVHLDTQLSSNTSPCSLKTPPAKSQHRRSHSASHFFHLSSLKRHSPAQFNLALCYEHGKGGVDRDLEKAIYFYQQAANQGHAKASYNMGCICYNHGELSKAISWFESAGKCSVRGLRKDPLDQPQTGCGRAPSSLKFPLLSQTTSSHELEDMLLGDLASTSGPFAAYFPAILCLALLCRQGVQNRDHETILKKDPSQSIELLQSLLQKASPRSHLGTKRDRLILEQPGLVKSWGQLHGTGGDMGNSSPGLTSPNPPDSPESSGHPLSSSIFSSSCPSLLRRSVTVQDRMHDRSFQIQEHPLERPSEQPGVDDHETWSVTLAQQLLNAWKSTQTTEALAPATELSMEVGKKILRHHLLYITNPTLSKNLYNLGVLYDLYMGNSAIAIKCYRSAFQNSLDSPIFDPQQRPSPVTRINSAWNLGILHVRCKEWRVAQEWFLHAQRDIVLRERQQRHCQQPVTVHESSRGRLDDDDDDITHHQVRDNEIGKPMLNVVPKNKASPSDSPGQKHAQEHFDAVAPGLRGVYSLSTGQNRGKVNMAQSRMVDGSEDMSENEIRTDANKIAWILRWVKSQTDTQVS
ncbi:hypothetical protein BGZ65_012605 [Modicella reniformis]|uniref:HCP-like protein n=1 Tax=Modicella reniformis TaxID=1440133 RepID=A0A9P6J3L2_9FUNG|nr:hypothetical protein BGZ65_012605 [Modicella reniformis]